MDENEDIQDLIASYALGSLDQEEVARVEALLAESNKARQALAQFQQVADLMGMAVAEIEPSASFEDRLFSRISESSHESKVETPVQSKPSSNDTNLTFLQKLSGLFARPTWQIATGLALALFMFSTVYMFSLNRQIQNFVEARQAEDERRLPTFELASTDNVASNSGLIVMSRDGQDGAVIIDGMEHPADDSQYQLWLIDDGVVEAGPTFELNDRGYGNRWVKSQKPLDSYDHFMVTLEPAGGSDRPTGEPVLEWIDIHDPGHVER